ncbi:S1C family serine protease [Calidithermus roseus]|uniref:Putative serine protease HtrA n=1 Tax=Calidithermus roseus TaxID=1644118 RepID=A0A399EYQ7_9DEIN|nr:trypsin-like peptidase domain-containing protein [Calidithermus roseus]RIH89694.1 putative serine protease HtrA [Calidithermus roseus]
MKSTVLKTSSLLAVAVLSGSALWFAFSHGQSSTAPSPVPSSLQGLLSDERNTVEIAQTASEGVVYISVRSNPAASLPDNLQPFAPFLQPQPQQGTGSGFVLDKQGHILTNYHVVQGASQITVRFKDSPKSYTAKVLGTAQPLDLAVIQVQAPAELLKPLALGDSDQVRVGEKTIAIGNPFGLDYSVSTGIVSAVRRNPGAVDALVPTLIQTDAAINPGNSGGPLLNSRAQVIGINTAIISPSGQFGNAQNAGVGFAIPINLAKQYLKQLEQGKNISDKEILASRPRLGVSVVPLAAYNPQTLKANNLPEDGLMVQSVEKGSPAEKAGLKAPTKFLQVQAPDGTVQQLGLNGDVIQEVNGTPIQDINDLRGVLEGAAGQPVTLKIWREGQSLTVTATPQLLASN